jgi:hypothetical protein
MQGTIVITKGSEIGEKVSFREEAMMTEAEAKVMWP